MSASRCGVASDSSTASMPCWRGSGPIAFSCLAEMPSVMNSANEPCASGTPSAA